MAMVFSRPVSPASRVILIVFGLVGIAMALTSVVAIAAGLAAMVRPALVPGVAAPWVLILLGLMLAVPAAAALLARGWYARLLRAQRTPPPGS
jgi:FtsH-binding integral membrane protein